jgi:hypothetical protein
MATWDYTLFADLMAMDPYRAYEYRRDTLGEPIPEQYLPKDSQYSDEKIADTAPTTPSGGYSKADIAKLLKDAGVAFSNAQPIEKLMEKAIAANLV